MNHADNPVSRVSGWAVGAWTILVMAAVLGLASNQTSQLIGTHFQFEEHRIATAAKALELAAKPAVGRYHTLPFIMTVPLAVTRTQRMMVAKVKHPTDFAARTERFRSGLTSARGLLAGLALIGAQSSSH